MIFAGFPGVLSFFQVFQVFQVEWEPCWLLFNNRALSTDAVSYAANWPGLEPSTVNGDHQLFTRCSVLFLWPFNVIMTSTKYYLCTLGLHTTSSVTSSTRLQRAFFSKTASSDWSQCSKKLVSTRISSKDLFTEKFATWTNSNCISKEAIHHKTISLSQNDLALTSAFVHCNRNLTTTGKDNMFFSGEVIFFIVGHFWIKWTGSQTSFETMTQTQT